MFSLFIDLLITVFAISALLIIFLVLMQRPKSEGLGAAFGGGMTENLFGAQTSNVLANATRWLGGIFFFLALLLSIVEAKVSKPKSSIQENLLKAPAVAATPAASGTGAALFTGTAVPALTSTAAAVTGSLNDVKVLPMASPTNPLMKNTTLDSSTPAPVATPAAVSATPAASAAPVSHGTSTH